MDTLKDRWTAAHDLALVYIALAYGTDHDLSNEELNAITALLKEWRTDMTAAEVQEVVMEAMTIYLEEGAREEVVRSIGSLGKTLSEERRQRALADVVRIAEADGVLLTSEQSLITALAEAWKIRATGERLLDWATAEVEAVPAWSLLHDFGLLYLVVAHSADAALSDPEIAAIVERLRSWQPALEEEEARRVLRDVLQLYAQEPGEAALGRSVEAIKDALTGVQRLAVLDDLAYIARAGGPLNAHARKMISALAKAWDVTVHVDGRTASASPS